MLLANTVAATSERADGNCWSLATKLGRTLQVMFKPPSNDQSGFAIRYYVPYFKALEAEKLTETFASVVTQAASSAETKEWLAKNQEEVQKLLAWSNAYRWPDMK